MSIQYRILIENVVALREAIEAVKGGVLTCPTQLLFHQQEVRKIDTRVGWADLASSERTLLRFVWEAYHRIECPFPLRMQ
jgi:hypothetical protein